jgi:small subunit ribosomal protein S9
MADTVEQYNGVGRRKSSVARVYLRPGTGTWEVNGRPLETYLNRMSSRQHAQEPLVVAQAQGRFDVKVRVAGGGETGQAGAIRMGLARALVKYDEELRGPMRTGGFLTRDPRVVERKKPGQPGARKRFQFSKR